MNTIQIDPRGNILPHPAQAPRSVPALQAFPDRLYVVTCVSNPQRYAARYALYRAFAKHMDDSGVTLITVECAFGGRPFEVTNAHSPNHVQVRTNDELWHKENLMNLGIARVPAGANYIACIDADFTFVREDWAQETLQQLQHHEVVQLFTDVQYRSPQGVIIQVIKGFMARYMAGETLNLKGNLIKNDLIFTREAPTWGAAPSSHAYHDGESPVGATTMSPTRAYVGGWGQPGGAWAYRREALDALGGLVDFSAIGSGDYFMAAALIGALGIVLPDGYSDGFKAKLMAWQSRAERFIRRNVGLVEGSVLHSWHGKLKDRGYNIREQIHYIYKFDPDLDLKKDTQGLWQLDDDGTPRSIKLRDELRAYFRSRNEDSVDVS